VTTLVRCASRSVPSGVRPHSAKSHFLLLSRLLVRQDSPSLSPRLEPSRAADGVCEDQERAIGRIAGIAGLAVSLYADRKYPECTFFQEKFDKLKAATRRETTIVKEVGTLIEREQNEFENLWRDLSNEWVHTKGRADRIVSYVSQHQDVPPWGLIIPLQYTESDISDLKTLEEDIAELRRFVRTAMEKNFT